MPAQANELCSVKIWIAPDWRMAGGIWHVRFWRGGISWDCPGKVKTRMNPSWADSDVSDSGYWLYRVLLARPRQVVGVCSAVGEQR